MDREWIVMLFTLVKGTDPALTCEKKTTTTNNYIRICFICFNRFRTRYETKHSPYGVNLKYQLSISVIIF